MARHRSFLVNLLFFLAAQFTFMAIEAADCKAVSLLAFLPGENAGDQFGVSIAKVGDVNGDSYVDLLVGASLEDTGGNAAGKCYLYLGSAFADTIPDLTGTGVAGEKFGSTVAGGGDLNGDGLADFAVSSSVSGDNGSPGRVRVYFGSSTPDFVEDLVVGETRVNARFGESVALEGDLNGDGFADLVVGAPGADSTGAVYVYYGGGWMDSIPDLVLHGRSPGDRFGSSVATGGDLNGDGFDDLVVGDYLNSDFYPWGGKAFVYLGGSPMDTVPDLEIPGESLGDGFGFAVEICPDINGDSYDDLLVSAPYHDAFPFSDVGKVYLFLGGAALDGTSDGVLTGEVQDEDFGYSIDSGDVNGDGLSDFLVGAPNYSATGGQEGKVYMFYGSYPIDQQPDFTAVGTGSYDGLGISVAVLGMFRFHPDGTGDFAAGAWNMNGTGAVELYGEPISPTGVGDGRLQTAPSLTVFPNPCRGVLHIKTNLTLGSRIELDAYDVHGRKVARIYEGNLDEGVSEFSWRTDLRAGGLSEGVYFIRLRSNGFTSSSKVLILR